MISLPYPCAAQVSLYFLVADHFLHIRNEEQVGFILENSWIKPLSKGPVIDQFRAPNHFMSAIVEETWQKKPQPVANALRHRRRKDAKTIGKKVR